jgi:hypothetical protein
MAINVQRQERSVDFNFDKPKTPVSVGPGTYNPRKQNSYALQNENVAPFNSMKERESHFPSENPGKFVKS